MSKNVNGLIAWLRQWFDDIYALKSEGTGETSDISGFDVNKVYPVGSIYMSVNNSDPSELFGGRWIQIEDKFLIGASYGGFGLGSTGGEAYHTLTTSEMPSHTHTQNAHRHTAAADKFLVSPDNVKINGTKRSLPSTGSAGYIVYADSAGGITEQQYTANATATNQNTGGGEGHNNLPPYLAVNIWKRVPYYYNASTINWNVTSDCLRDLNLPTVVKMGTIDKWIMENLE